MTVITDPAAVVPMIGSLALFASFLLHGSGVFLPAKARAFARAAACTLALSFGALVACFLLSFFSVKLVYLHSSTLKPMLYKAAATWGNHEGSLLLFCLLLGGYTAAFTFLGKEQKNQVGSLLETLSAGVRTEALRVACACAALMEAYTLFLSDPFILLSPAPLEGQGFNPLLQDPSLAIHPPALYLGYAGLVVPYALAVSALRRGEAGRAFAKEARKLTLFAWGFLTGGIALGSAWAYRELGWGGFWFWDPVENASLMPWLAVCAAAHSLTVTVRTGKGGAASVAFLAASAAAALGGFFLVRSGAVTSVHAFASDPERGICLLALFAACVGYSAYVFFTAPPAAPKSEDGPFLSRSLALSLQNVWMTVALFAVALGTLYPLLAAGLAGVSVSVGAPYFAAVFVPLGAVFLALLAAGSVFAGKDRRPARTLLWERFIPWLAAWAIALAIAFGAGEAPYGFMVLFPLCAAGMALQCLIFAADLREAGGPRALPPRAWRVHGAHTGAWLISAGIVLASYLGTDKEFSVRPGDTLTLSGYRAVYREMTRERGLNYLALRCRLDVYDGQTFLGTAEPEARYYPTEEQQTAETALLGAGLAELGFAAGEASPDGRAGIRMMYRPGMDLIRLGACIAAISILTGALGFPRKPSHARS